MMRWGRRKSSPLSSSSSSSSSSSFMSHVSPFSWLSKFKQMRINSDSSASARLKQKGNTTNDPKSSSLSVASSQCACEESYHEGKKSTEDVVRTELCNLQEEDEVVVPSEKKHGRKEGTLKLKKKKKKKKDTGIDEGSKILRDTEIPLEIDDEEYNREKELEKLRRTFERKAQRVLQERLLKLEKEAEKANKDVIQLESSSPRTICTPRTLSFVPSVVSKNNSIILGGLNEGGLFSKKNLQKQNLKKNEMVIMKERKTKHRSSKVRIHSPRMASKVEICRIKALEDMKKAKVRMKKEKERIMMEESSAEGLDSFAVVKCSFSPEKDFRDSMVEMITELQLNQPEEMEELLACFLTLNSDEYHDLIVKVFREVWFDMNKDVLTISI